MTLKVQAVGTFAALPNLKIHEVFIKPPLVNSLNPQTPKTLKPLNPKPAKP